MTLLVKGGRVVKPAMNQDEIADILIENGKIIEIGSNLQADGATVYDASGLVVAPGFIDTDMTAKLEENQQQALLAQIPLGRLGKPDDVAHAVAFLASPQAGYITGQELHVNGGMFMA